MEPWASQERTDTRVFTGKRWENQGTSQVPGVKDQVSPLREKLGWGLAVVELKPYWGRIFI